MAVIAIMAALAAASAGIYSGYVEQAREAELYETAEQIKNALAICEAQYGEAGGSDASVFWSEAFLAPPNHRDSVLYPYVGTMTEDCTGYSLKIKRNGKGGILLQVLRIPRKNMRSHGRKMMGLL